ncbi:uncharacterized protein LOC114943614 [Nylanderia fulva]|uniref:uncharacterized protein LOC114930313 n=1 Tax=Nylanderia fulva TaxID=613905 RepID=UPI0010FAF746|nr:uncharacterized protein LOC114930313 [Nylanderia fulva]XP_029169190.1 uncharacterized protein LOC114939128 [Nylanderia fulva]XP_029175100.1 uncharacterized protein LOC114943614 [Nylanderia fulva]
MRYFSKKCDAQIPHSLRGTELRKHIATTCITLNLSDNEVDDLANFMGHHEKIHKRHYRQSIAAVEIVRMTKFLEAALGENEQQQSNNSDSEEEEMQETNKDTSSAESENDAETCMISSPSPFGITKRRRWTEEERNTILKEFQKEITTSQLPSNKKISCVKEKNKCLFNRSVAQIKTWIHNYISGKIKRH